MGCSAVGYEAKSTKNERFAFSNSPGALQGGSGVFQLESDSLGRPFFGIHFRISVSKFQFSNLMKNLFCPSLLAFLTISASPAFEARAQNAPEMEIFNDAPNGATPAQSGASRVAQVEENALATLPALLTKNGGPGAVSLRASEEAFEADPAARDALSVWVRAGGVVFLHTGAARAFGFKTVAARLGTNALAGQLYGRARAALPFGAHPLLWDGGQTGRAASIAGSGISAAPGADPLRLPGVNVVFYQLREGDDLVVSHPAGTPLLEVSDLSGGARTPLYAAAMAPFGKGFAVFTPDFIDQKRGDGALFARNLLNLLAPAGQKSGFSAGTSLVGIAASAIENGATKTAVLQSALAAASTRQSASPALPAFGVTTPNGAGNPQARADAMAARDAADAQTPLENRIEAPVPREIIEAQVVLTRAEAASYARLLAAGGDRAGAAINLLRARLFLSRSESEKAARAVEATAGLAPGVAEFALWRGILLADAAQEINQPSPVRAQLLNDAAQNLAQAARASSLTSGISKGNADNVGIANPDNTATLGGISLAAVRAWSVKLNQIAQVYALEPPLVQQYGTGSGAITVRAVAQDTSLRLIVPGAQALANSRAFGWRGDNEEVLLFPTPESFAVYRRALGLSGPTVPLPAGAVGDVAGQRILMLALPSTPAVRRNPTTGQITILGTRNSAANVLARLHSYVLLRAYDENGRAPAWLQLGLESLANIAIAGNTEVIGDTQLLEQVAGAGGLLTPRQFGTGFGSNRPDQLTIAQAQAAALIAYFYRAHGAGAVTETVQRLSAGQNIDTALLATTQDDEIALFENWRGAQFGPRNFPNAR